MKMGKIGAALGFTAKLIETTKSVAKVQAVPFETPKLAEDAKTEPIVVTPSEEECLGFEELELDEYGIVSQDTASPRILFGLDVEIDTLGSMKGELYQEGDTRITPQAISSSMAEAETESIKSADSGKTKFSTPTHASVYLAPSTRSQETESVKTAESKKKNKMMSIKSITRSFVSIQRAPSNNTHGTGSAETSKSNKKRNKKTPYPLTTFRIQPASSTITEPLSIDGYPLVIQDGTAMQSTSPAMMLIMKDKMAMQETPQPQPFTIAGYPLIIEDGTATILTTKRSLTRSAGTFDTFDASTIKSTNSSMSTRSVELYSDSNSTANTAGTTNRAKDSDARELWVNLACQGDNAFDVAASAGAAMGLVPTPSTMSMYDDDSSYSGDTLMSRSPAFGCSALDVECAEDKYIVIGDELILLDGENNSLSNSILCGDESVMSKNASPFFESELTTSMLRGHSLLDSESVMDGSTAVKEKAVIIGGIGEGVEVPLPDIDINSARSTVTTVKTKKKTNGNALKKSVRSFFGGEAKKVREAAKVTTAE